MRENEGSISHKMAGQKSPDSVDTAVNARLETQPQGWVFAPDVFFGLGRRPAVDMALATQLLRGHIRRLARGIYGRPKTHPQPGLLSPSMEALAEALKGRDAIRLQPSGAQAANLLGKSEVVPMRVDLLTDGISRHVKIGQREIVLKQTAPRNTAAAGRVSGTVIQALRWLGAQHVEDGAINALKLRLNEGGKRTFLKDIRYAPAWVGKLTRIIAQAHTHA